MPDSSPVLSLRGYGVCFGRRVVLAEVDLELPAHGVDVLMGPVKAGKSTLMRSLAGLNDASATFRCWGRAELDGRTITGDHRPSLVQQHASVLGGRVADALWAQARSAGLAGANARQAEETRACLEDHGLGTLAARLDESILDVPVEWRRALNILSHALARPALLMVDEPTFGLEDRAAERLIDWLRHLAGRQRLLVTLHHQGQARRLADRITLLAGGRVLGQQDAEAFFTRPVNAWVEQFVRSGSLAIAAPDARPEDLSDDAQPPPDLPQAALDALETLVGTCPIPAAEPEQPPAAVEAIAVAVENGAVSSRYGEHPERTVAAQDKAPTAPMRPRAALPGLSTWGVEAASRVGLERSSGRLGPAGFVWILPGRLAGCPEPGVVAPMDYDLDLLVSAGITCLITLTEHDLSQEALARHGLINLHLPIYDREAPSIVQTYMLVRRMQLLLEQGHVLAVHCKAGIGRTGAVLAAWLIREGGLSAETAIERLRVVKPTFVQTEAQEQFLHDFEQDILSRM